MHRRKFLAASVAASASLLARESEAQAKPTIAQEFYLLRKYLLLSGPQTELTENYFSNALIPALKRMGIGPVGAFRLEYGPETPAFYLLIPASSAEVLAQLDLRLAEDAGFMKAAEPFWNAPATAPAFQRVEASLLSAFPGWPRITPPSGTAGKQKRIFQLRTYESPSNRDHVRKVKMFHSGEFEIFLNAGFHPVFFSDVLVGPRLPKLTYMLSFTDMAELEARWDAFRDAPAWKKLSSDPQFSYEAIVSNISNQILSPLAASQI